MADGAIGTLPLIVGARFSLMQLGKLARVLGLAGGLGAIAWAMRDRFVTLAVSRDSDHPTFTLPPEPAESPGQGPDDLTVIAGIGPVFNRRLMEAGIATFADLAEAEAQKVADIAGVPLSRAEPWKEQALQRR